MAVLGGGLMGGGIAMVTIGAGLEVRLKDKDDAGVGRGLSHVQGLLDERVNRGQITQQEQRETLSRLTATTGWTGLRHADVVLEAVFEDLALKQSILREVEARTSDHAIFASNTSSIPITRIAEASKRPSRVVGMHYFSPVHKMPLLEVIRTDKTAPDVVATAVALGKKQGKTVIVVKDGVGFYTSRILGPYMNEALYLVSEGVPIDAIDEALVAWGWPVGPLQLVDEVGIDVAAHVGKGMHEAYGARMAPPGAPDLLVKDDRKGRKNGRGFYRYDKDAQKGGKRQVDATIYKALGHSGAAPIADGGDPDALHAPPGERGARAFDDGVLRGPAGRGHRGDLRAGLPAVSRRARSRYVDTVGAAEVLRRMRGYEDRFGARWTPAEGLVARARTGRRFYEDG